MVPLTCHDLISRKAFSPLPLVMALTACLTILSAGWAEAPAAQSATKMTKIAARRVRFVIENIACFILLSLTDLVDYSRASKYYQSMNGQVMTRCLIPCLPNH